VSLSRYPTERVEVFVSGGGVLSGEAHPAAATAQRRESRAYERADDERAERRRAHQDCGECTIGLPRR
jgi:hypothetical protein